MKTEKRLIVAMAFASLLCALQVRADAQPETPGAKPATPAAKPERKPEPAPLPTAATLTAGSATVRQENVNVRGGPSLQSDVVSKLKRGDRVQVLEEIPAPRAKADEPPKWAKIALPTNVHVWVSSHFIDPATKTVKANRLNLRSGPGENYSILGRINKDTAVKEIETKGTWIKIEAPENTYAYVAAHLLAQEPPALAARTPETPTPVTPTPPATTPATVPGVTTPTATETNVVTPTVAVAPTEPAPTSAPPGTVTLNPVVTPTTATPEAPTTLIATPPPPPPQPEEVVLVKRVVTREGVVKRSVSIQAPTYFVLEGVQDKRVINYLWSPSTNVVLKDFKGQRILVTGEESLDERWTTPVITVETLQTVE